MQWAGIMAFSQNHLPLIQHLSSNVVYAMNCNGMGVSLSPMIAEELTNTI
jgi:gamma-glutamylputrescine oxidase